MPVKRDENGNRSVQVEVEVPGTPEEVWNAIATAEGVSSWFVPTTSEHDANGVPVKIISNFGPGMESVSTVTGWNPPESLSAESKDLGPDAPSIATQWIVEARSGGVCVVRVVHSLFTDSDEWDNSLEAWESGWPDFFRLLRLYVAHFSGQPCASIQLTGFAPAPKETAWRALLDELGFADVATDLHVESSGAAPEMAGTAVDRGDTAHQEEALLRLDGPAPGIAHLFAMDMGGQVLLSIRIHAYGDDADTIIAREEPKWQAWLASKFQGSPAG